MRHERVKRPSRARQAFMGTKEARRIRMNEAEDRVMWKHFPGATAPPKRKVTPQRVNLLKHAPRVHRFETSEEAYDASQTDDRIHDGDILITKEGPIAILMRAWPMAVTKNRGRFHTLQKGISWNDYENGAYLRSYRIAMRLVKNLRRRVTSSGTENDPQRPKHSRASTKRAHLRKVIRARKVPRDRPLRRLTVEQLRDLVRRSPYPDVRREARRELDDRSWEKNWGRDTDSLRSYSVAALMKMLRQAIRQGNEAKAEAIGKELDRRAKRVGRDAEDDYQFEGRVMRAIRMAPIAWKPGPMSAQQWPPRYTHVREAGGEFFVISPDGDVIGVFATLAAAARKARGADKLYLRKYGRR